MGGASLVTMNHLDKTLETDCLGSEGVHLQSSQVDCGHGVAKPGGVEQVSPFSKAGEGDIDISCIT